MKYKRVSLVILFLIIYCIPVSADFAEDQRTIDTINKIMQTMGKDVAEDVNRNVDENFGTLDQRLVSAQQRLFRKAVFALLGVFTIVLFGYAYVMSRITRQYDLNFYEKMMDNKIDKLRNMSTSHIVSGTESFYMPITHSQFDKKYLAPEKYFDDYFNKDKEMIVNQQKQIKKMQKMIEDLQSGKKKTKKGKDVEFYGSIYEEKRLKMKKVKRIFGFIIGFVIFVAIIVLLYIFLKQKYLSGGVV